MTNRNPEETREFAMSGVDAFYDALTSSDTVQIQELPRRVSLMNARPSIKLRHIQVVADNLFRHAAGRSACARGCAHCCYIAVPISVAEARLIGERIGVTPKDVTNFPRRDEKSFSDKTPCTFLKNDECSVYDSRPLECRANFNFDRDNYWCRYENWEKPGASVPKPVFRELYVAYGKASKKPLDSVAGDIRDFFPNGFLQAGL